MNGGEKRVISFLHDENPAEPQKTEIALNGVNNRYQNKFYNRTSVLRSTSLLSTKYNDMCKVF